MMLKILTVFLKTSDIIVDSLCDISPSLMYKTICDILQKEDVDHDDILMYHVASIQLMEAYLWKGTSAQQVL
jgi:hypothetical protein